MQGDVPKPLDTTSTNIVANTNRSNAVQSVPQPLRFGKRQLEPSGREKHRDQKPVVPPELLKDIVAAARVICKDHKARFLVDRKLKECSARLFRTLLPPRPRRPGRKRIARVTRAMRLQRRLKRKYPTARPAEIWAKIYPNGL